MLDLQQEFDALFDDPTCLRPIAERVQATLDKTLRLVPGAQNLLTDAASDDMRRIIWQRLSQILCPSLTTQLADYLDESELIEYVILANSAGPQAKERIRKFCQRFDEGKLAQLYERAPLLQGFVERVTWNCAEFLSEFLHRFADKRAEISTRFFGGQDIGKITSLSALSYRQRGRAVIRVQCGERRFYYKPRDCRVDAFFHGLVGTFFSDITIAPDVISGEGFGFCSELVAAPVEGDDHIGRYFFNYGAVAALCISLNGVDVHGANVIACGTYPGVIDLETLLTPSLTSAASAFLTRAEWAEEASIAYLAILPHRNYLQDSQRGALTQTADPENRNLPVYNGKAYDVVGYEEHFVAGFREGYRRTLAARADILAALSNCRSMTVRSLYNISAFYSALIMLLLRPDNLTSTERQDKIFAHLDIAHTVRGRDLYESVISYEKRSLLEGDSPCFCADLFGTDLCGDNVSDVLVQGGLEKTPFDGARDKLASLSEEELAMEEKLIRVGFAHGLYDDDRTYEEPLQERCASLAEEDLNAELLVLLRKLHADAIAAVDQTVFWRSSNLEFTGRRSCGHATLQADAMSLASAALCASRDGVVREEATYLLNRCVDGVSAKLRLWTGSGASPTLPPGLMNGLGGILRGCLLAEKTGLPAARELANDMVGFVCEDTPWELEKPGLREGVSGLLLALCAAPPRTDATAELKRLAAIRLLAERLAAMLRDGGPELLRPTDPLVGVAGVGTALAAAQKALGEMRYGARIQEAFATVCGSWRESIRGWYSRQRRGTPLERGAYAAGIGLCAIGALERVEDADGSIARCLDLALRSEMDDGMLHRQDVLDNGNALRVLFLNAADTRRPDSGYGDRARAIMSQMIARKRMVGDFVVSGDGLSNSFDPALLVGSTGIGFALVDCMPRC